MMSEIGDDMGGVSLYQLTRSLSASSRENKAAFIQLLQIYAPCISPTSAALHVSVLTLNELYEDDTQIMIVCSI